MFTRVMVSWLVLLSFFVGVLSSVTHGGEIAICTFNVYKLGAVDDKYLDLNGDYLGDEEIPERVQNLANVLVEEELDIIVLQEVHAWERGHAVIRDLIQALDTFHGVRYEYILSDHIGRGLIPEAIAFLYKPGTVRAVPLNQLGVMSELIPIPGRDLVKTEWVAGDFDFALVSAHLAWGNRGDRDEGFKKVADILNNPSNYSDDPDIIVLGDFNRFGSGYSSVDYLDYDEGEFLAPNVQFFDPDVHSVKAVTKSSISGKGVIGDNPQMLSTTVAKNTYVYDLVLFTMDCEEEYTAGGEPGDLGKDFGIIYFDEPGLIGYQSGAGQMSHNQLKEAYSDHRPLYARFRTNAGAADSEAANPAVADEPLFVGTTSGARFHLLDCWTIRDRELSHQWFTAEAALGDRRPCGVCKPLD